MSLSSSGVKRADFGRWDEELIASQRYGGEDKGIYSLREI